LEGLNKDYNTTVLLTACAKERVDHKFIFRPLDVVPVPGRSNEEDHLQVFELVERNLENASARLCLPMNVR